MRITIKYAITRSFLFLFFCIIFPLQDLSVFASHHSSILGLLPFSGQ